MLVQLAIADFAIIKDLEISLKSGLNVLSGETGAGKSIIINAVNLILGGRASADLIRTGCKEARVEALFIVPENQVLEEMLSDLGFSFGGELLIKRTVSREGRNKISINGSLATLQMLSRIGALLISVSGQYEHQLLLKPDNHLYLLDDFGGLSEERAKFTEVFNRYQSLKEEMRVLEKKLREILEKQELNRFQIQEIEEAGINPGEDQGLVEEKRRLQHAEELLEIVTEGYQVLYERNDSLLSTISQFMKKLDKGAEIDNRFAAVRDGLREVEIALEDISFALRDFQKSINRDPYRLEEVMERLELLNRLKRKYGPSLVDVLQFRDELAGVMFDLDEKKLRLEQLEKERREVETDLLDRAITLSKKRKKVSKELEKAVERELQHLHMQNTRFRVRFEKERSTGRKKGEGAVSELGADGFDQIEFMIAPNIGEDLRPLSKIASGGELSRLMLAIKTIVARTASVETIIFDEVDSGISGATAEVIGDKVLSLTKYHQIICITHLPQIASKGQTHFLVRKRVADGRTQTAISELDQKERVQEIARLLGGKEITPRAVARAREMLSLD